MLCTVEEFGEPVVDLSRDAEGKKEKRLEGRIFQRASRVESRESSLVLGGLQLSPFKSASNARVSLHRRDEQE